MPKLFQYNYTDFWQRSLRTVSIVALIILSMSNSSLQRSAVAQGLSQASEELGILSLKPFTLGTTFQDCKKIAGFENAPSYSEHYAANLPATWFLKDAVHRMVCFDFANLNTRDCIFEELSKAGWSREPRTVGGVKQEFKLHFVNDGACYRLGEITTKFKPSDFQTVKDALVFKYKDGNKNLSAITSKSGESHQQEEITWGAGRYRISLKKYSDPSLACSELVYRDCVLERLCEDKKTKVIEAHSKDY